MTATNSEEILVLYGSQTGNSEGTAQEICSLLPTKIVASSCTITARVMHLDDFLEIEKAAWPRLVVIVCSSYGVGQAPIGARKFRDFCDALLERYEVDSINKRKQILEGVNFALLGLGDSHYTTYFQNPTTIHQALTAVGATHVGELGKADASGTGTNEQYKVIDRWIASIWGELIKVVATAERPEQQVLDRARDETWELCLELFPEWKPVKNYAVKNYAGMAALYVPLLGVIVAVLAHFFLSGGWDQ